MPRLFFSGCLFLCSIYRQQHSFLSTSLFCKIKMPNFSLASHYKVGSVPLVSCSWAECLGMSLFAHEALHRCHVPTTPMFCSSFMWPCLMQPTTVFHSSVAVLDIYDIRNNSFTWPFFCPVEFKIPHWNTDGATQPGVLWKTWTEL